MRVLSADDPKYTCIVVVHKPANNKGIYGGTVTAPVFKKIADWVYSRTPIKVPNTPELVNVEKEIKSAPSIRYNAEGSRIPNLIGKSGENVIRFLKIWDWM